MITSRNGSVFLLVLTCMTVIFIMGFALTFFTGSEDHASSMSYETEVAFNLAESAVEEFVARLKNSLNNDDSNNQLYKVLRAYDLDISKEIPLDEAQVAKLTSYTRETARQIYGMQFDRDLLDSENFDVSATIKLQHINAVEATNGNQVLYSLKKDTKEKQGELEVIAKITYRGRAAQVSLKFLIRVIKTFVPPFHAFTLYVKDASIYGGSFFNNKESGAGVQEVRPGQEETTGGILRLDNGWNVVSKDFNAITDFAHWEKELSLTGKDAPTPPGRIYLGQDPQTFMQAGSSVIIRSTNGAKALTGTNIPINETYSRQINGQENFFLKFDVPWMKLKDYFEDVMELQGQQVKDENFFKSIFGGSWKGDTKIRIFNVGAGKELVASVTDGPPSFINCFLSYENHTDQLIRQTLGYPSSDESMMKKRLMPSITHSGFDPFGNAPPIGGQIDPDGSSDGTKLSPTLIYGPAMRQYFRAVQVDPTGNQRDEEIFELPFVDKAIAEGDMEISEKKEMNATEAYNLFVRSGVPMEFVEKLSRNWENLPDNFRELKHYTNFMSDSGMENYNRGLINFLQRMRKDFKKYDGPLKGIAEYPLENEPYHFSNQVPEGLSSFLRDSPMTELYLGNLWEALPDKFSTYLMDFYFIPRSTEDFFRGRTTVAIGGNSYDRFAFKYINNVQAYLGGAKNQTLELNGILALNDSEPLGLNNLKFRGHGIIYSSPMMGGGKVVIRGDFLGVDTDVNTINSSIGNDMMTIVAPQIIIDTSAAQSGRCYVEANLISVSEPLMVIGDKSVTIKGTVVTPYLNLMEHFKVPGENVIIYNALNGIWRKNMPNLTDSLYVAKIVTGGVGKFDWKYERTR